MEVKVCNTAGFCFGVKRAVDSVYETMKSEGTVYTYGPVVHNKSVVKELEDKGVVTLNSYEELNELCHDEKRKKDAIVVIRAHGVPKSVYTLMEESGIRYTDATCPFVKRIHEIVSGVEKTKLTAIVGDPEHPEVVGIKGWVSGECIVINDSDGLEELSLPKDREIVVVSQTTYNYNKFQDIVEKIKKKGYNVNVVNTICNATETRQRQSEDLAREADVMIVIGGKHSSNTAKLYEICSKECEKTYYIETLDDLHLELPKAVRLVGITAGASTPNKLIEEVQNYVRINF
ncbi:MAG: 4-hydroxy-3-methylbut-2-enyl diphosphate reductase [Lachnospiraceae bacterium]|nr:4-hydroxy-3-methylbut-2-enyl diphosphate reductase [Lachnospiraceae bacterium]